MTQVARGPLFAPRPARLGFGAWAVGGTGWGPPSDEADRLRTIRQAADRGVWLFDTAPTYGSSEALLGRALGERRDEVGVATKVGPDDDPRSSLERSLRRLGTERVELLQLHEAGERFERSLEAMHQLKLEGKARAIGICNATPRHIARAQEIAPIETYQGAYNLFDREAERRVLPMCREMGISFLAFRPLASGLLTGKFGGPSAPSFDEGDHRRRIYWFRGRELDRRRRVMGQLQALAERRGGTLTGLALSWALSRPGVSFVLAGARTVDQVDENVNATITPLSNREIEEIDNAVARAYRPARATAEARRLSAGWGDRERFIVARLDGEASYDAIAADWSESADVPMSAAQVRTFVDQLAERGQVSAGE